MKIVGTVKKKTLTLNELDVVLTIDEIDELIDFLNYSKKSFLERQKDCCVKKLIDKDGVFCSEDITSYTKIVEIGNELIDYHSHYKDWCKTDSQIDIVIHTTFRAEKKEDDTFIWAN